MIFNSVEFLIFLPIVFLLYWIFLHKFRWMLLLVASYIFYMCWNVKFTLLFLMTTVVTYISALLLEKTKKTYLRKIIMTTTLLICFGVLFYFKYFNFFLQAIADFFKLLSINKKPAILSIILPMGISFYTFQTISYVIDVYKGKYKAEKHFGYYALYISFFPQLVAGPIERWDNLMPQLKTERKFNDDEVAYGLKIMCWGFFKKICIADILGMYVSSVYSSLDNHSGFSLVIAMLFFTIQIYCDFSGYSDIAIGSAKILGINLMKNFDSPYYSKSVKEFWSRWHISLSTWFRDYVYIPLGGNRCGKLRQSFNLLVVFLISGLWHGANWTFIIWGGIHGLAQIIEKMSSKAFKPVENKRIWRIASMIFVFIFINLTWVLFRADSISDAFYVFAHMFDGLGGGLSYFVNGFRALSINLFTLMKISISVIMLFVYDYFSLKCDVIGKVSKLSVALRWLIYVIFVVWICFTAKLGDTTFIYFQF